MKQHVKTLVTVRSRDGALTQFNVDTIDSKGTDAALIASMDAIRTGGTVTAEPVRGLNINSKSFLFQNGTDYRAVVARNESKARTLGNMGGSWSLVAQGEVDPSKPFLKFTP